VALSGGVDSAVAAARLAREGAEVVAVHYRTGVTGEDPCSPARGRSCCGVDDARDARAVAARLGVPFYVVDASAEFGLRVVDAFVAACAQGLTPNPCIACNKHIRFDYLLNYARRLGADFLATGHYARLRRQADGTVHLLQAVDAAKDQSYVLSVMGQAELRNVLFPVGEFTKAEVRAMAAARGLPTASKHDSMDLCFVADDDYRRFLADWAADAMRPGPILDRAGQVLGQHAGLPGYTIGQRKGLGIGGSSEPLYVLALDPQHNALIVGTERELGRSTLVATGVNWTLDAAPADGTRVDCKIRYKAQPAACVLHPQPDGSVRVHFDQPLRDIAPGQGAVFYAGDLCLGGGIIAP
jgi:tRNA-specific 2-thiouridylase